MLNFLLSIHCITGLHLGWTVVLVDCQHRIVASSVTKVIDYCSQLLYLSNCNYNWLPVSEKVIIILDYNYNCMLLHWKRLFFWMEFAPVWKLFRWQRYCDCCCKSSSNCHRLTPAWKRCATHWHWKVCGQRGGESSIWCTGLSKWLTPLASRLPTSHFQDYRLLWKCMHGVCHFVLYIYRKPVFQ